MYYYTHPTANIKREVTKVPAPILEDTTEGTTL